MTPEEIKTRGKQLFEQGKVTPHPPEGKPEYAIVEDFDGDVLCDNRVFRDSKTEKLSCPCSRFKNLVRVNPDFECEHIAAVRFFYEERKKYVAERIKTHPQAKNLKELIRPEQLRKIQEHEDICDITTSELVKRKYGVRPEELWHEAAAEFIQRLPDMASAYRKAMEEFDRTRDQYELVPAEVVEQEEMAQ
jgi:NifB/MoaA-like Fe-S oxidoreductase